MQDYSIINPLLFTPERISLFWAKVDKSNPESCWLWTGCKLHNGYGQFGAGKGERRAHRIAWILTNGPIPDGMNVLHNCPGGDNPACVNPAHLFIGTQQENILDAINKHGLRGEGGYCQGFAKPRVTEAQVKEIRALHLQGIPRAELARRFDMSKTGIEHIINRRNWKHVA